MKKKSDPPKRSRDAGTGRFVKEEFAKKNPKTTVTETVKDAAPAAAKKPKKK